MMCGFCLKLYYHLSTAVRLFTFFFWASMALRFSSSFILSWIISDAMTWEGSLGEGVIGEGDVIGKGGVEI